MLNTLISFALISSFNPAQLFSSIDSNHAKEALKPVRLGKVHYTLVQRWTAADAGSGKKEEKEQTVCNGDVDAPVFNFGDNDTIPANEFRSVDCYASPKPAGAIAGADAKPSHIKLNFFIVYMNLDIFGEQSMTKNFISYVAPQDIRQATTGFASATDMKASGYAYPTRSVASYSDYYQIDSADYIVSARFTDEAK